MAPETPAPRIAATVMANGVATPYQRCGAGPTVVALGLESHQIDKLACSHRVIAPDRIDDAACLGGFLDGLGLTGVTIVTAATFADMAESCAAADGERVKRVVRLE